MSIGIIRILIKHKLHIIQRSNNNNNNNNQLTMFFFVSYFLYILLEIIFTNKLMNKKVTLK